MDKWVKYYEDVMGFVNFLSLMINNITEYSLNEQLRQWKWIYKILTNEPWKVKGNHKLKNI